MPAIQMRQQPTQKILSTYFGITVGYVELSRHSLTFRGLRLFGLNRH